MTSDDDRGLARRAAQGDGQAFGELIQRYQGAVFNVAYRMTGSLPDADDIARRRLFVPTARSPAMIPKGPSVPYVQHHRGTGMSQLLPQQLSYWIVVR